MDFLFWNWHQFLKLKKIIQNLQKMKIPVHLKHMKLSMHQKEHRQHL